MTCRIDVGGKGGGARRGQKSYLPVYPPPVSYFLKSFLLPFGITVN